MDQLRDQPADQAMRATLAQLCAAIDGAVLAAGAAPDTQVEGLSTDSRRLPAGALFLALRGEHFDAHDFLDQVAASGVAAVVVERLPAGWTLPAIVVPDALLALGQIARFWRRRFSLPLIGVTGSNGKTTVKEMIASILAAAYGADATLATRGNLNNEVGVPLTVLRLSAGDRAAVVELGMNHPGEIARLSAIAEPTVALVNNAQREHQEFMHTVEAVARENGAALAALGPNGVAVFPHGDPFTPLWRELSGARRTLTFGLAWQADISASYHSGDFGSVLSVRVRQDGRSPLQFEVALQAAGEHNVRNALAAAACAYAAGIDTAHIQHGLEQFAPVGGRLQRKFGPDGVVLIDDSYNANPDSVRAAIDVLAQAGAPRILVLGDMGEVGVNGAQFHQEIADYAQEKGIESVLATGQLARQMAAANLTHFEQLADLLAALDGALARLAGGPKPTVLIKGSRFMKMERVVQHLMGTSIGAHANESQHSNKETD